ncbi:MAG: hypothetical protein ACYCUM_00635 [Solirubrobacteraceae bacterium]
MAEPAAVDDGDDGSALRGRAFVLVLSERLYARDLVARRAVVLGELRLDDHLRVFRRNEEIGRLHEARHALAIPRRPSIDAMQVEQLLDGVLDEPADDARN